jgi:hypothetical protein
MSNNHKPESIEDKLTRLRDIFNEQVIQNNIDTDKINDKIKYKEKEKDRDKIILSMKTIIDIYIKYNSKSANPNTQKSRFGRFKNGARRTAKGFKNGLGAAASTFGQAVKSGALASMSMLPRG